MRKPAFGDRAPGSRCPLRRAESTVAGCNYASSSSSGIISRESAEAQVAKSAVHERTERLTGGIGVLEELGYVLPRRLTRAPPGKQAPGAGRAEAVDQMVTEVLGQDLGVVLPDRPVQPGQRQQHERLQDDDAGRAERLERVCERGCRGARSHLDSA